MTDGIQRISDEELSRWIAEKLEPLPFDGYVVDLSQESTTINPWTKDAGPTYRQSPKTGAWQQRILYNQTIQDVDWNPWQPRDMVNDPAMTLMLLGKMLVSGTVVSIAATDGGYKAQIEFPKPNPMYTPAREFSSEVDFIGRAVAELYAKARGYPETLDRTTKET